MAGRQTYSLDEIKDMLHARIDQVVDIYAPAANGAYHDRHLYFTLNPGRADRSVGSFCIHMSGAKIGRWNDFANGTHGDVIDLIALSYNLSLQDAVREARTFLGLENDSPEARIARARAADQAKARRLAAERDAVAQAEKLARDAAGLYLSAAPDIMGTPVEAYLRGRGIDATQLRHVPGALRYHHALQFYEERTDPETGEVTTTRQKMPGMVASIVNGKGKIIGVHRTYLAFQPDGRVVKADVSAAKKVLGTAKGGRITLSSGIGPNGGKGIPLAQCSPGTRVYIAEGIETGLSAVLLKPDARVLACISLANMGQIELPPNVAEVVLLSDNDTSPQAIEGFRLAVEAHAKAGRRVRVWRSETPGEDLNDALKRALQERGAA